MMLAKLSSLQQRRQRRPMRPQGIPTSTLTARKLKAKDAAPRIQDPEREVVIRTRSHLGGKSKATVRIFPPHNTHLDKG